MGSADELLSRLLNECPTPETQIRKEALSYALDHMENSPAMKALCLNLLEHELSTGELPALVSEAGVPEKPLQEEYRITLRGLGYGREAHRMISDGLGLH